MYSRDADTTIVKVALQIEEASALVLKDDTDNLCFLIHHVVYLRNNTYLQKT